MASSMIIPTYADIYGRRKVVFGCCVISVMCAIALLFSRHLFPTYVIMFVWGAIASGNFMVSSVYTTETCPTEWQTWQSLCGCYTQDILLLFSPIWFKYISRDYRHWMFLGFVCNLYCIFGFLFFIMESPLWLVKQGRREDSDNAIKKMMKINGYKGDFDFLEIN